MNELWNLGETAAREQGEAPFLTDLRDGRTWSYEDLHRRSAAFAGWLRTQGVGPGERVAFFTKDDPAFFPMLFGCASQGVTLVPLNPEYEASERAAVLENCEPALVLADRAMGDGVQVREEDWFTGAAAPPVSVPDQQDAIIIYTSGTTGRSKGVVLSQRNLVRMSGTLASVYGYRPGQRFLSMLPYYHINAPVVTGLACITGRSHVFLAGIFGFANARWILPWTEEHRLQVLSLTPSIMASLLKLNPQGISQDLSSVEFGLVGTAYLPEPLWRRFETAAGFHCYQGYGLTETTTWATMTPPDERKRLDSAGVPIGTELRIDEAAGGEVLIRGDIVMNGYFRRKNLTKKVLQDGWFRTGDIGRLDTDGQLVITGRIKNIIKRRGVLISPEEVDEVVRRCDGVVDACTVGVEDEMSGERVVTACVVDPARLDLVAAEARQGLSAYKHPDDFVCVHEIPKTGMGKPDTTTLRRWVTGQAAEDLVRAIDVYKFRRARTEDLPTIQGLAQEALRSGRPLRFVGFWGVGSRAALAEPDRVALDRLRSFLRAADQGAGQPVARLTLILADIHARCNQVPVEVSAPYLEAVRGAAVERGFDTVTLGDLWARAGLDFGAVLRDLDTGVGQDAFDAFALRADFIQQAERRCGDPALAEQFARRYHLTITRENEAVAAAFPDAVFLTYNGPEFRCALPPLPLLHLHSLKPGTAAKPWFLGDA